MDRLWVLTASLQNQKLKIQSNIFENIFEGKGHLHKVTGIVRQLTETASFRRQFVDRKVVGLIRTYCLLAGDAN